MTGKTLLIVKQSRGKQQLLMQKLNSAVISATTRASQQIIPFTPDFSTMPVTFLVA
jgi:hypothetical protein